MRLTRRSPTGWSLSRRRRRLDQRRSRFVVPHLRIVTFVHRKSRLVALPGGHRSDQLLTALVAALVGLTAEKVVALTRNQGSEMAAHDQSAELFRDGCPSPIPVFPWVRGTNEKHQWPDAPVPAQGHRPASPRRHRARRILAAGGGSRLSPGTRTGRGAAPGTRSTATSPGGSSGRDATPDTCPERVARSAGRGPPLPSTWSPDRLSVLSVSPYCAGVTATADERTVFPADAPARFDDLTRLLGAAEPGTTYLLGPGGQQVVLPAEVFDVLRDVAEDLSRGLAVTVAPRQTVLTTSQAADVLGVSRPTLVRLLERGEIPFEQPGRHRRVRLVDVLAHRDRARRRRAAALDELVRASEEAGLYENDEPGELVARTPRHRPQTRPRPRSGDGDR